MSDRQARHDSAFVRTEMVPDRDPPPLETGVVKWLRENLFSSIPNAIMTVLSILAIYWVLDHIMPWMWYGIWDASSLTECRAIRDDIYGEGVRDVACWAILVDRWDQLTFGFYPSDAYWRPVVALGVFLVALAPILYDSLPRQMLYLTPAAPFLIYFLLWGGPIWGPILVALGFVVGYVVLRFLQEARLPDILRSVLGVVLGLAIGAMVSYAAYFLTMAVWGGFGWFSLTGVTLTEVVAVDFALSVVLNILRFILWFLVLVALVLLAVGTVLGGPAVAYAIFRGVQHAAPVAAIVVGVFAAFVWWGIVVGPVTEWIYAILPLGLESVPSDDFGGFLLAFVIGIAGIMLSLPLGVLLALGRQSDLFIINKLSVFFIEVIRGVPLIVWLFTASLLLTYFLPPGTNFDLMLRVIIMVTLFSAAYIAEVIRGGLAALPRGQYEGADSLGLDYWQSMRLVILPQALKISIPGIVSTFIGLFKDTTLVVFIGLLDPVGFSNAIRATTDWNGVYWELFIFIGLCFFVCCFGMSKYSQYLERKLRTDHR